MLMVQFPAPFPPDGILTPASFNQLVVCLFTTMMSVCILSILLPRNQFVALFKRTFPWMSDKLG
jgi:hypothetical protein